MILFVLIINYNQNNGCFKKTKKIRRQAVQGLQKHVYGIINFVKKLNNNDVYFLFSASHK